MLPIFEELFLLSIDEEKGIVLSSAKKSLAYGLAGGIIAELVLQGKVSLSDKSRLEVANSDPTGDEILDKALDEIGSSEKTRKLSYWVDQFSAQPKKFRERLGERLVAKEVLFQEDQHLFRHNVPVDSQSEFNTKFELKYRLRSIILTNVEEDDHNLALLSLASSSELLNLIFTLDEILAARKGIKEKVLRRAMENSALQAIEELGQAVSSSMEDDAD
jgi:golgi phosphoprotein 3